MQSGRSKRRLFEQLEERLALATYFVSNQGNDNQNGASGTPWLTLQKAADTVVAGDTVIVRAGTYTGFDLRRDGTAASRITFSAEAGVADQPAQRAHARRHQPGRRRLRDDRGIRGGRHAASRASAR